MMQEVEEDGHAIAVTDNEDEGTPPGPAEDAVADHQSKSTPAGAESQGTKSGAASSEEDAQKAALINQVLELQNTLDELSGRVNRVKEENSKLKSENEVLTQYIENLMASSSVIHTSSGAGSSSSSGKKSIASLWSGFGGAKKS